MNKIEERFMIRGCVLGKANSQKKLYDQFSSEMFKVCLMYSSDYDDASDLLQEGFLKVFQNIHKYKSGGSFKGWVRRVFVNTCIDIYRKDKWSKLRVEIDNVETEIESEEPDFTDSLYERDDFLRIIKSLPLGYSMILNLYFLEDMTHKEIAEHLEITIGTSKSQLFKAKKYLKKILLKNLTKDEIELYEGFTRKVV